MVKIETGSAQNLDGGLPSLRDTGVKGGAKPQGPRAAQEWGEWPSCPCVPASRCVFFWWVCGLDPSNERVYADEEFHRVEVKHIIAKVHKLDSRRKENLVFVSVVFVGFEIAKREHWGSL